ncbi:hypothetical protein HPB51_020354 [Rhipicephalus microplus]|uniref:Tick transposon n=1 Tax=Rhipicephalus microplus TaxID=6941 RepID=A0A9J6DWU3_RHIMP|nr:hypothetical protein HPB51_020354 [Rhipicephalus microplus]
MVKRTQKEVRGIFLSSRGCSPSWSLRLYTAATSRLRYAFLAVAIPRRLLERLEMLHRGFIRCVLGLPRSSQVATTLAEAGVWPLSLLLKQRGFLHIDQLAHAPDRCPLLALLESRPGYRMGELRQIYQAAVGPMPPAVPLHRPAEKALAINTGLGGLSKRQSPICPLKKASASKIEEEWAGKLIEYMDGSVIPDTGSAIASYVMPALGRTVSCHLRFAACSTAVDTAGLHLAIDLPAATPFNVPHDYYVRLNRCVAGISKAGTDRLRTAGACHQTACLSVEFRQCFSALSPISCENPVKPAGSCPGEKSTSLRHACVPHRGRIRLFEAHIEEVVTTQPP